MAARAGETVRVDCRITGAETGKALQIEVDTGRASLELVWIPLSTVHEIHRQDGYIVVDEWIARERGLV